MALQTKTVATGDYAWKSWSNGYVISLTLTEESADVATNTSVISYLFTISNTNNNRFTDSNNSWSISIGGQNIAISGFSFDLSANYTTQTIASGRVTVAHNADGTLQMPYSVSVPNIQSWNKYGPPAMALTGTWALTAIPRVSTVSCPVGIIGQPVTLSIHKAEADFTHTITYAFGALSGTVAEKTTQAQIAWTIPPAFYTQIPNARRGQGILICKSYSDSILIGESRCDLWADIDEAASRPVISAAVEDVNEITTALTGDGNILIRYHSNAQVTATYSAKNGAVIANSGFIHNGKEYAEPTVTLQGVEVGGFDFFVTDSRGLEANLSVAKQVIPYVRLSCNLANSKPDGEGNMTLDLSGNFFAGSFGAQENTLTVQYRYKLSGTAWLDTEEEWQTAEPVLVGNTYTVQAQLSGLNYKKAYTFQARAMDRLETVNSIEFTARTMPIFDWGEEDFAIHGDLQVDGKLNIGSVPVLNTPHVQTYYWRTTGGVSLQSVADFMATCKSDCAFITMIHGDAYPFAGLAVGSVCIGGTYGAGTLYDYQNGARNFRLFGGEMIVS